MRLLHLGVVWLLLLSVIVVGAQNIGPVPPVNLPPSGAAGGDLSGTFPNPTVAKVNGSTPGGTCTNQFARSLSTSAVPTCATIGAADLPAGQYPGTTTNDNATSGNIGEFVSSGACPGSGTTATVTITIATPGVVTWTAHGITGACPVVFTTTGALPTGITAGTTYWVVPSSVAANTFQIATSVDTALASTSINTSGTQSGTQTGTAGAPLATATPANITGISISGGDWECRGTISRNLNSATSVTVLQGSIWVISASLSGQGTEGQTTLATAANVMGVVGTDTKIGPVRYSRGGTTTLYLVANDTFTVNTNRGYGIVGCRRAR